MVCVSWADSVVAVACAQEHAVLLIHSVVSGKKKVFVDGSLYHEETKVSADVTAVPLTAPLLFTVFVLWWFCSVNWVSFSTRFNSTTICWLSSSMASATMRTVRARRAVVVRVLPL